MPRFTDSDEMSWGFTPAERVRTREIVAELRRVRAERAALEAREARLLAEANAIVREQMARSGAASEYEFPMRSMATELALAVRESPRGFPGRMGHAATLVERFPATLDALAAGTIAGGHVRAVVDAGAPIDDADARAAYEAEVLEAAARTTPGRLKALAERLAEKHAMVPLAARHDLVRAERRVWVEDLPDGMAMLGIVGSALTVHAAYERLTSMGAAVVRDRRAATRDLDDTTAADDPRTAPDDPRAALATDPRSLDQLRADLAADLLLSGTPSGHDPARAITATVEITIPVSTLTGTNDGPALLAGYGPIDPGTARRLAAHAPGWERLFADPQTGALLTVDHYTPTAAQRRYLRARDRTCRVPGCTTTATHTDIDHTIPASRGGPTHVANLGCLCEPHHMMKHHSPWRLIQLPHGRFRWISPCGYEHTDDPPLIYTGHHPRGPAPF